MKNNRSSDLTRSATLDDFVLMEVDNERIPSLMRVGSARRLPVLTMVD
jgi:hypothetical protein